MSTISLQLQKLTHLKVRAISLPSVFVPWKILIWAGVAMVCLLASLYVVQINQLTREYYMVTASQKAMRLLTEENRNLQISFAENSYLASVVEKAKGMDFQSTNSVQYIHIADNSFAVAIPKN